MQLPALVFLLVALTPSSTHAAEQLLSGVDGKQAPKQLLRSLDGQHGYALIEQLDELAASPEFALLFADASPAVDNLGRPYKPELEREFTAIAARLESPQLRHLVGRISNALFATITLLPEPQLREIIFEAEQPQSWTEMLAELSAPDIPADLRRHLRHIMRGQVALVCASFGNKTEVLQRELLTHAAVGVETNLRLVAAMMNDRKHAQDILADLRLDPIDLDALHRRGEELQAARASLREAQDALPGFRLPPDPALQS